MTAGLTALAAITPSARADEAKVATVGDYQILRSDDAASAHRCRMFRQYVNKKDNGVVSAISASPGDGSVVLSLVYGAWTWAKAPNYQTRISIDRELINDKQMWYGADSALAAKFPDSILPKLYAGSRVILGFSDGDRDFDLTGFKAAYAATLKCNAAPPPPAAASTAAVPPPAATPPAVNAPMPPAAATAPAPVAGPAAVAIARPVSPSLAPTASAEEARAVAYLVGSYEQWAIANCGMQASTLLRDALESRQAALEPEVAAIKPRLLAAAGPFDPKMCPPPAVLESTLQTLIDEEDGAFVAKADPKVVAEFQKIVRPVLAARATAPDGPGAAARSPAGAQGLPARSRVAAYVFGVGLQDVVARCDIATTGKQRAAVGTLVTALKPEMVPVEAALRHAMEKPGACPTPEGADRLLALLGDGAPDSVALAVDRARPGEVSRIADDVLAASASPVPSEARISAYAFGLLLQDTVKHCDIRSTGRQRDGVDTKVAAMAPEMASVEPKLREELRHGGDACPPPARTGDIEAALQLFLDRSPEDFAAEMDRRQAPPKTEPAKP